MTRFLLTAAAALVAAALAVPALGAPPEKIDTPVWDQTFPAGVVCPFEVSLTSHGHHGQTKLFFDAEGGVRMQWVGTMVFTVRNEETGRELVVRTSGMNRVLLGPLGFDAPYSQTGSGKAIYWLFPGEPGGPSLFLTRGKYTATFQPGDVLTSFVMSGPRTDLCAAVG